MIADLHEQPWRWPILGPLLRRAFAPRDACPIAEWARKKVFLSRRITTKPGPYDVEEFPWTYECQDFFRTRTAYERTMPDGAVCLVDGPGEGVTSEPLTQCTWMKSSVAGVTEAALNGVRWICAEDPHNVIFSIDNRVEAGNINEVRLQPTLRALGQGIFTAKDEDAGKFLLKLERNLVYFLGSYSSGAFANKMAETCIGDELEEHGSLKGDTSSVENLRSRLKSAERPLLFLMSKPKLSDGPIATEHDDGSQHVYEIPCPRCTERNGGVPAGYQQLLQENMRFDHCRDLLGNWDKKRVLQETYFECIHCKSPIPESAKRWFNHRTRRRWRRTNFQATPGHVSFHISDFYGYHSDASWGRLALRYIKSKGDPVARQGYRNHHEGLPWELRATKTTDKQIKACMGDYKRGIIPRKPWIVLLGADVGLTYVKWAVVAFSTAGEAWVIDWGVGAHPNDLADVIAQRRYLCAEDGQSYRIQHGYVDAKYRKPDVHKACLFYGFSAKLKKYVDRHRLWPIAGISADLSSRSISFNRVPDRPKWFGITVFVDRDAKHELYTERINGWAEFREQLAKDPSALEEPPNAPPLWFPSDVMAWEDFVKELTNEHLVQRTMDRGGADAFLPHASKEYEWKRKGPNHWGDGVKVAIVGYRYLTRRSADPAPASPVDAEEEARRAAAVLAAVMTDPAAD